MWDYHNKKKSLVAFVIWFCYAVGAVLVLKFFLVFSRNFRHSDRGGVQNTPKKALFKCQFKYIYLNSNFTFKTKRKRNVVGLNSSIFFFFFFGTSGNNSSSCWEKVLGASEEASILFLCPMYSGRDTEKFEWELKEAFFVRIPLSWYGVCSRKEDRRWD